jgi:hypothetical protein
VAVNYGRLTLALAAGVAAFVLVGAGVTELVAPRIAFSAIVGLPAGGLAGLLTAVLVVVLFRRGTNRRRRLARVLGGVGVGFLIGGLAGLAVGLRVSRSLLAGVAVGGVFGVVTLLGRGPIASVR